MAQATLNISSKALKAYMAAQKKLDIQTKTEYDKAFCVSRERGDVWNGKRLCETFSRTAFAAHGATKLCHLKDENGNKFKFIVIKRFRKHGMDWHGNQLVSEIRAWEKLANTEYGDALCPILKYNMERSDKAGAHLSEKGKDRCVIVAQRAVFVGDAEQACEEAHRLNEEAGIREEREMLPVARKAYLEKVSNEMGWWDAMDNDGNSGVIFDYSKSCYKAVFIDYAL